MGNNQTFASYNKTINYLECYKFYLKQYHLEIEYNQHLQIQMLQCDENELQSNQNNEKSVINLQDSQDKSQSWQMKIYEIISYIIYNYLIVLINEIRKAQNNIDGNRLIPQPSSMIKLLLKSFQIMLKRTFKQSIVNYNGSKPQSWHKSGKGSPQEGKQIKGNLKIFQQQSRITTQIYFDKVMTSDNKNENIFGDILF
ncbi:hypothetical protein pb186bvf_002452 [Paramecium bursaria]